MSVVCEQDFFAALAARHGKALQKKLRRSTVAVCGLGGLGSHIAVCLARAGVGRLSIIDNDCVELSNLHRQQYQLRHIGQKKTQALTQLLQEINPFMEIEAHTLRLTPAQISLLRCADVVCEAFDDARQKVMLIDAVCSQLPGKPIVAASGMAGFADANEIRTRRLTSQLIICGDGHTEVSQADCLFASRVMLCAAHQAHAALQLLASNTHHHINM